MKSRFYSTADDPIKFFKQFYDEETIISWFFSDFIEEMEVEGSNKNIVKGKYGIYEDTYLEYFCNRDFAHTKATIVEVVKNRIRYHKNQTVNIIDKNVLQQVKDSKEYKRLLEFYLEELGKLEKKRKPLFQKYKFLLSPLIEIQNHINTRYLDGTIRIDDIKFDSEEEELIHNCFSYLNGLNEEGGRIMKEQDFIRLIDYLKSYHSNADIPKVESKIPDLNGVDQLTLRRTFYVFWKKIKGQGKHSRESVPKFLKAVFNQFDNTQEKTLYDNLTKKPPFWKSFVPDVIKE